MEHKCFCEHPGHCPWHDIIIDRTDLIRCRDGYPPSNVVESRPCIYLGKELEENGGVVLYECRRFGKCTICQNNFALPACFGCQEKLRLDWDMSKFRDPLLVTDRDKTPTDALQGMLAGGAAFLVCGGPSLKQLELEQLQRRGIFSMGVNNVAGMAPVDAFVCSDPPMKFHNGIFQDPKIMKFLPLPKLSGSRSKLRYKQDGKFYWHTKTVQDCPNVWGFQRRSWMMPDQTFFTEPSASWGNQNEGVRRLGQPKTACTMLLAIRLLYHLGARTIFLLGCDFRMDLKVGKTENYAFAENRDEQAIRSNNDQYRIVNQWLVELQPWFERFGLWVFNCHQMSGLRAFPFVPYDVALQIALEEFPQIPFDLNGWYAKETEK